MLTATYSLVAIAAEQDKARSILCKLQKYVQTTWKGLQNIDLGFLDSAYDRMRQLDTYCRGRKIEMYLIPALRSVSREADVLLAELDSLSGKTSSLLRVIGDRLNRAYDLGMHAVDELCTAMDSYCNHLFVRFDKEERELLPLARRVLSVEDWFSIAAQCLSDDTDAYGRKRRPAHPALAASAQQDASAADAR